MIASQERPRSPLLMTRVASLVAIGVVAGWGLASIPNVELVTAICFTAGFLLGTAGGLLCGALTETIFAGFHPMGTSFGVLLLSQVIGMSFTGWLGSVASRLSGEKPNLRFILTVILAGVLSTLFFDFVTNLAYPITAGFSFSQTLVVLAAGVPFAAIHLISNTIVFAVLVVPLLPRLRKALSVQ